MSRSRPNAVIDSVRSVGRPKGSGKGVAAAKVLVSAEPQLLSAAASRAASEGVSVREVWRRAMRGYLGLADTKRPASK